MHLDEERLQRVLHAELPAADREAAEQHLGECASCRERLAAAKRDEEEIFGLLRRVDHPVPAFDADLLATRARRQIRHRRLQWAAGILLMLGAAGLAYTAPGSPFPIWLARTMGWITHSTPPPSPSAPARPLSDPGPTSSPGIAVTPGARLSIRIVAVRSPGEVEVTLIDGAELVVRARGGAPSFATDADLLTIRHGEGATAYAIEIPRDAPWVELRLEDRRVFLKEGARIVNDGMSGGDGRYRVTFDPAASSP